MSKEIIEAENRIKTLINRLPAGLMILTMDGTIESISPPLEQLSGFLAKEVQGKKIFSFFDSHRSNAELISFLNEEATNYLVSTKINTKSGQQTDVEFTTSIASTTDENRIVICVLDKSKNRIDL